MHLFVHYYELMTSVNKFNKAISKVRGIPVATVDSYSRRLRDNGIFPSTSRGRGASSVTPEHVAMGLFSIMRGSPIKAADNAIEVGELKPHSEGGNISDPILGAQLATIGWTKDTTLAEAIADIITRVAKGKTNELFGLQLGGQPSGFTLKIDKYWTQASLKWYPTLEIIEAWENGAKALSEDIRYAFKPDRLGNGYLSRAMEIKFHSPLFRDLEVTYGTDAEGNREAGRKLQILREKASKYDLYGNESITLLTIETLAKLFENDGD